MVGRGDRRNQGRGGESGLRSVSHPPQQRGLSDIERSGSRQRAAMYDVGRTVTLTTLTQFAESFEQARVIEIAQDPKGKAPSLLEISETPRLIYGKPRPKVATHGIPEGISRNGSASATENIDYRLVGADLSIREYMFTLKPDSPKEKGKFPLWIVLADLPLAEQSSRYVMMSEQLVTVEPGTAIEPRLVAEKSPKFIAEIGFVIADSIEAARYTTTVAGWKMPPEFTLGPLELLDAPEADLLQHR